MRYQQRAAPPPADDPLEFVMSDASVDRMGDVIEQDGWSLANFRKSPIALFNHDRDQVIGRWREVAVRDGKLRGFLELAEEGTSALVDTIRALVRQRILRAVSVGFRALKSEPLNPDDDDKPWGALRFLKSELLECSLVSVPANPNALAIVRAFPRDVVAEVFREPANENRDRSARAPAPAKAGVNGKPAKSLASPPARGHAARPAMKTLAQRITDAQTQHTSLRDRLAALAANDNLSDDEQTQFDALPGEIEQAQQNLEKLKRAEKALAPRAAANDNAGAADNDNSDGDGGDFSFAGEVRQVTEAHKRPLGLRKRKLEPLDYLVRSTAVQLLAYARKESLGTVLRDLYKDDEGTAIILRAAVSPATTTGPGWAAELVQSVNAEFLDTLKPASIYGPLSARGARFTFGRAGVIKIPGRATTPNLAGSWVGENQPKPVRRLQFNVVELRPTKLAVISLFTEEIAEHSTPAIEQIIRDAMRDDTSAAIDGYLIDNVAVSATRPAGLLNGVIALTPSTEALPLAIVADLKALTAAIVANNGGRDIVFLVNPVQAMGLEFAQSTTGEFITIPSGLTGRIISSNTVPTGTVIAIDAADFASATGDVPRYSVSNEATVHMEDTTPLQLVTGAQGSGVVASPTASLWQQDLIGVRMHWPIHWVMRRAGMISYMADVAW